MRNDDVDSLLKMTIDSLLKDDDLLIQLGAGKSSLLDILAGQVRFYISKMDDSSIENR